jgi:Cdc6-like AAA superfamily ATPase
MKSNRFSSNAIQYACKKMASYTSDVRKLLEIFKRALEMKKEGVISLEDMV